MKMNIRTSQISSQTLKPPELSRRFVVIVLAACLLAVVFLSYTTLLNGSLRLDESQSLFQSSRNASGVLKLVAEDVHVPLFHLILHFWLQMFGNDIAVARIISLIFFIVAIVGTYHLGALVYSRRVGLTAAVLMSLSPFMNWYGNELRMYTMLAAVTVINQYFFVRVYHENKRAYWIGYTLSAVIGIYTHYFFWLVLVTEGLFYILSRNDFPRRSFKRFLATATTLVVAIAPWLGYVYILGFASNTRPSLVPPSSIDLFNTYSQFLFGFQDDHINTLLIAIWPVTVLLIFLALQKNRQLNRETLFFVMMAVVPVAGAFVLSLTLQPFFLSRYLIVALPSLFLTIGAVFSMYTPKVGSLLRTGFVVASAAAFMVMVWNPATPVKENYAEANAYLSSNAQVQDVIIVSAPFTIYPFEYYYRGDAKLSTLPAWDRFESGAIPAFYEEALPEEVKNANDSYRKAWLVLSFDQGYQSKIKDYYDQHFERLEAHTFSSDLHVYAYKLRYDKAVRLGAVP